MGCRPALSNPKGSTIRAFAARGTVFHAPLIVISNGSTFWQANAAQRLWFLQSFRFLDQASYISMTFTAACERQARYLGLRGNR